MTKVGLDAEAGLRRGTIQSIESGANKNPSWIVVSRIMKALHARGLTGLTPEAVFGGTRDAVGASSGSGRGE